MDNYTRTDFYLDAGVTIKQEVIDGGNYNTSASVPIPSRRIMDYHDMQFDLETSQSPSYTDVNLLADIPSNEGNMMWSTRMGLDSDLTKNEALIHMDDDDIFQVDKADLIQGPTLAELNANDDTLLGDLNFDDLLLPEENYTNYTNIPIMPKSNTAALQMNSNLHSNRINNNHSTLTVSSCPQTGLGFYRENMDIGTSTTYSLFGNNKSSMGQFTSADQSCSSSPLQMRGTPPLLQSPMNQKHSTLHELLLKKETGDHSPDRIVLGQSVPGPTTPSMGSSGLRMPRSHISRLSSSAPTHLGLDQFWQRREPRKHLLSTGSLAEAGSTSSLSTGGILSPDPQDLSHDEFDSDEDSEHYEDFSSDNGDSDDDNDEQSSRTSSGSPSKKERFFWQYNVQAKGPKGQRLVMKAKMEDPHILNEVTDPVFSPDCAVRGIKHSGKARKGDGNDLTPNPRKLYNIGKELDKLGRIINDMTPVSELPFNVRPKTRKEKNKLASRACRLKKKAQHEANKIKLQGLETEHKRLLNGIAQTKQILAAKIGETSTENQEELSKHAEKVAKSATKIKIAGHTTDYVNKVLEKLKVGSHAASLDDL